VSGSVAWIHIAPVKGLALQSLDDVELTEAGPVGDRSFFLVDETNRLVNAKGVGILQQVRPVHDAAEGTLELHLPGDEVVRGDVVLGEEIEVNFWRTHPVVPLVVGPWSRAISDLTGKELRLVASPRPAVDRGRSAGASLVSTAALRSLADELGVDSVDGRRFRMHFGVDGTEPHAEDEWLGRKVAIGEAVVIPGGNVGRCAVTTQDPDTGEPDLDTLKALARYREGVETTEKLPFGVYAFVSRGGRVRVGDQVALAD
jgi:uncharacterized protein